MSALESFKAKNPTYFRDAERRRRADGTARRYALRREYGLDADDYERMRQAQGGCCAICGAREYGWKANAGRLVVDHCHQSKRVRGLLCPACNRGLGQFEDDPKRLLRATKYLKRSKDGQ